MPPYSPSSRPRKRYLLWLGVVVVLIAAIYFGRGMFSSEEADAPGGFATPVEMATVTPKPLAVTLESVGTLVANESVTLRPEIAGRITKIAFTEGQPIEKGELLFQIDDRIYQANLKQAAAQLQLARLNYNRFAKLSKSGAATKARFDEAQANLGVAQAAVDQAKAQLDYTRIEAPFDGVVGLRSVSPGDYVNVGQDLANFVSYHPMKVNFTIPETDANVLAVGQQIDITVEALRGETFRGTVFALDPQLDVSGRAVALRATIPNEDNQLRPGYFARVVLTVKNKENALMIPEAAIVPQGDQKFVYRVDETSTVNLVPLTIGQRLAGEVEILDGLAAGDRVVTSGQIKLHPGAKVMDNAAMAQPSAETPEAAETETPAMPQEMAAPKPAPDMQAPVADVPAADEPLSQPVFEAPLAPAEGPATLPTGEEVPLIDPAPAAAMGEEMDE